MRNGKIPPPNLGLSLLSHLTRGGAWALRRGDRPLGSMPTFLQTQVKPKRLSASVSPSVPWFAPGCEGRAPFRALGSTDGSGPEESCSTPTLENRPKQPRQLMMQYTLGRRGPRPAGWGGTERPFRAAASAGLLLAGADGAQGWSLGPGDSWGEVGRMEKGLAAQRFCLWHGQQGGRSSHQSQKQMARQGPSSAAIGTSSICGLQRTGARGLWR